MDKWEERREAWRARQSQAHDEVFALRSKGAKEINDIVAGWLHAAYEATAGEVTLGRDNAVYRIVEYDGNQMWTVTLPGDKYPDWATLNYIAYDGPRTMGYVLITPHAFDDADRELMRDVGFEVWDCNNLESAFMNIEFETRGGPDLLV